MRARVITLAIFAIGLTGLASCDKESILQEGEIPSEINSYVNTHFPDKKIVQVLEDKDGFKKTYDVILEGNVKLEFNRKKSVISIESNERLPDSVIPAKILEYVQSNYVDNFITDWELEDKHQEVELDNDLQLEFSLSGDFLRIDS